MNNMSNEYLVIIEAIIDYFGDEYRNDVYKNISNLTIEKENIKEPYYDSEKKKIVLPLNIFDDEYGNIIVTHMLLHASSNDESFNKENELYNEVIVDYMANDICKVLEKKGVNITNVSSPKYESNSVYSNYFDNVKEFVKENKEKIVGNMFGKYYFDESTEFNEIMDEGISFFSKENVCAKKR